MKRKMTNYIQKNDLKYCLLLISNHGGQMTVKTTSKMLKVGRGGNPW